MTTAGTGAAIVLSAGELALQEQFPPATGDNKMYQIGFSTNDGNLDFTGYFRGTQADLNVFQTAYKDPRTWTQFALAPLTQVGHQTTLIQRGLPNSSYTDQRTYNLAMQRFTQPGAYLVAAAPSGEHVELVYDSTHRKYDAIHGLGTSDEDIAALDDLLMTKKAIFEKADGRYKDAILNFRRGLTDEATLKNAYANYEIARRNFQAAVDSRSDGATKTDSLVEARTFLLANSDNQLYLTLAPEKTLSHNGLDYIQQTRQTAQNSWADYLNVKRYLGPTGEGRFATEEAKSTLLYTVTGAVHAAFEADKTNYSRDVIQSSDYTTQFPADYTQYFAPRNDDEFYALLIPYLKDPKTMEAPEFLTKRISPEQKELTDALFEAKKWGHCKGNVKRLLAKLPKAISRGICIGALGLGGGFVSLYEYFVTRVKSDVDLASDLSSAFEDQARIGEAGWTPARAAAGPVAAYASPAFQQMLADPILGPKAAPQGAVRLEQEIEAILDNSGFKTALVRMKQATDISAFDTILNHACDRDTKTPAAYIAELYEKLNDLGSLNHDYPQDPTLLVSALRGPYRTIKWTYDDVQKLINKRLAPIYYRKAELLSAQLADLHQQVALGETTAAAVTAVRDKLQALLNSLPMLHIDGLADQIYPEMEETGIIFKDPGINQLRTELEKQLRIANELALAAPITATIIGYRNEVDGLAQVALTRSSVATESVRHLIGDRLEITNARRLAIATMTFNGQVQDHNDTIARSSRIMQHQIRNGIFNNPRDTLLQAQTQSIRNDASIAAEQVRLNAETTATAVQAIAAAALAPAAAGAGNEEFFDALDV